MPDKKFYKGIDITYLPEMTVSLMKDLSEEELKKNKGAIDLENYALSLLQDFDSETAKYLQASIYLGHCLEEDKDILDEKDISQKVMYLRNLYEGNGFTVDYDKMVEYIQKGREVFHILNF